MKLTFQSRLCVGLLIGIFALGSTLAYPGPVRRVVILTSARTDAYGEAVTAIRDVLGGYGLTTEILDLSDMPPGASLPERVARAAPDVVIAVGTKALTVALTLPSGTPVVSTMTFRSEVAAATTPRDPAVRGAVVLDAPLFSLLSEMKGVLPSKMRAGMICNPLRPGPDPAELRAAAKQAGFTLVLRECRKADELLQVFLSLRDEVDFVWCPPESSLLNSSTIKPLILASIRSGLPIVGFSENFVRSGAAVGIYPDYADIGRRTAELARLAP